MSFIVKQEKKDGHEVSLHQDNDDVDIMIDGELVMTIVSGGYLIRYGCSSELGLTLDKYNRIQDSDDIDDEE